MRRRLGNRLWSWIGLWLIGVPLASTAGVTTAATPPLQTVAFPGAPAPGTGTLFSNVVAQYPSIDQLGNAGFVATAGTREGIWTGPPGGLSLVALEGSPVPASPTQTFRSPPDFAILSDHGGPLVYGGAIDNPTAIVGGEWLLQSPGGPQQLIVQSGMTAPGTSGASFQSPPGFTTVTTTGQYAFVNQLQLGGSVTSSNQVGVWANTGIGTLQLIARQGSQVPGLASGVNWQGTFGFPNISSNGTTILFATLSNGQSGIFALTPTTATPIAISGQAGIGTIDNRQIRVNASGAVTFYDGSIQLVDSGGTHKVAGVGSHVVGGGTLTAIFNGPRLSDDGRVFFSAAAGGSAGLYQATAAGTITPIAIPGQQVPGEPAGWKFHDVPYFQINARGQVALEANVLDPSNNQSPGYLFATDPAGNLTFVAGEGTKFLLEPGVTETIAQANLDPFNDADLSQFNNAGQLVFTVSTTDADSAIVVATIPEPSAATLTVGCAIALQLLRRRWPNSRTVPGAQDPSART
jgi:hypothetical protein